MLSKKEAQKELKSKNTKGIVSIVRVTSYRGVNVYIRKVGEDYLEWLIPFKGQMYSSYIIVEPEKGKKLKKIDIERSAEILYAGAGATIDELMGKELLKTKSLEN